MSPTSGTTGSTGGTNSVKPPPLLGFNNDLFMERTTALGCRNEDERARAAGLSRSGLDRLRKGRGEPSLPRAKAMAHALGVSIDDLFPEILDGADARPIKPDSKGTMTPKQRTLRARAASQKRWSQEGNRTAATQPAKKGFLARFELEVDPNGELSDEERTARARLAMKAHMSALALKSSRKRQKAA